MYSNSLQVAHYSLTKLLRSSRDDAIAAVDDSPEVVEHQYNAGPHLLSEVEPALSSHNDFVPQETILRNLINSSVVSHNEAVQDFVHSPVHRTKLSALRRIHDGKNKAKAAEVIQRRTRPILDDEFKIVSRHPSLHYSIPDANVDYVFMVPFRAFFAVVIPNDLGLQFPFKFVFNQRNRIWKCDKGTLGFPAKGSMMYLGESPNEHIWIAMAPEEFFDSPDPLPTPRDSEGDPRLQEAHHLAIVMMFSRFLHGMGYGAVTCFDRYPDPLTRASVAASTNLL